MVAVCFCLVSLTLCGHLAQSTPVLRTSFGAGSNSGLFNMDSYLQEMADKHREAEDQCVEAVANLMKNEGPGKSNFTEVCLLRFLSHDPCVRTVNGNPRMDCSNSSTAPPAGVYTDFFAKPPLRLGNEMTVVNVTQLIAMDVSVVDFSLYVSYNLQMRMMMTMPSNHRLEAIVPNNSFVTIYGYVLQAWNDHRFQWNKEKAEIETITIGPHMLSDSLTNSFIGAKRPGSFGTVWYPDLVDNEEPNPSLSSPLYAGSSYAVSSYSSYSAISPLSSSGSSTKFITPQTVKAHYNGTMESTLSLTNVDRNCVFDLESYPADKVVCCSTWHTSLNSNRIKFNRISSHGEMHRSWRSTMWLIKDISVVGKTATDLDKPNELNICIVAERKVGAKRTEVSVPMSAAAIMLIIAPWIPFLKGQLAFKLLVFITQLQCFQYFTISSTSHSLALGAPSTKIHRFYEFTIAMSLLSLIATIAISSLLNCKARIPPPHGLSLIMAIIGKFLRCFQITGDYKCAPSGGSYAVSGSNEIKLENNNGNIANGAVAQVEQPEPKKVNEWSQIWISLNSMLSALIIIFYIIGALLIFA